VTTGALAFRLLLAVQASPQLVGAQSPPPFQLEAAKLATPPVIDGRIEESEWQGASRAAGFLQYQPRRGEAASQPTEVWLAYDDSALYVAFRVHDDREPTAQLTRRDASLLDDDAVVLLLDTHGDRQSAYYFVTNLLGTQADGRIADDGRTVDASWDGRWRSAALRTEYGWSAEMLVPFETISFRQGPRVQWGINFGRSRRATLERSFWTGPLDSEYRISQAGALSGLDIPAPARRHQAIAYGLSRLQEGAAGEWDAGLDARYTIRSDVLLQGTLNPDFATIEADREQINLTRFELSFPEKRPFFLEGSELFRQRIATFYSRRIADIRGGAKLNAKQGPWTVALIWANEEPGPDTSPANFGVARLQRSLGRSNVAVMVTDRLRDGAHQGVASSDATLFFTRTLGMTAQWVETYGPSDQGRRGFFLRPAYDSPTGHFHVRYTHLGENVAENANAVGFIRDDDRRELDSAVEKTIFLAHGILEQIAYRSNYNVYWSQAGPLRSWEIVEGLSFQARNRWSLDLGHTEDLQRFEKDFRNRESRLSLGYNTREYESASVGYSLGRNFDADFRLFSASSAYKPTEQLSLEYALERLTFDPDPDGESTWIHVARADQFFTPDFFLRLFVQRNSALDRTIVQSVLVWRYAPPFGTLQLAFQRGTPGVGGQPSVGNTLFLKATAVF
jgi:hypothetical protein